MKTKKPGPGDVFFSGRSVALSGDSEGQSGTSDIAQYLNVPLLAELELTSAFPIWVDGKL
jgi:hypothetical protein